MMSEATPCVGGGMLNTVASVSATESGVTRLARCAAEVGAGHRAAGGLEVGGDLGGDVAAVEVGEAGAGDLLQRVGQPLGLEARADLGDLAVDEIVRGEAVGRRQLVEMLCGERVEGVGDRDAFPPERDRARRSGPAAGCGRRARWRSPCANSQTDTAPATVSAASPPRGGIAS